MGRDKDSSARKAGGRMAASSAGAAAMVASMGAGGGLTFAAFDPNATSTEQDLDPELSLTLKKLSKRDPTTKIKALGELLAFCRTEGEGGRTEEELALVLPQWQQPFQTLALDADRRVREALFETLGALVVRVKKHMTKHLRGLMLPWLCARFDTESSVRSAANVAFSALLPPAKIADALLYCKADILHGIDTNLAHTVQTLCDPKLYSKEEADETIARVHSSSLLSFAHMLEALPVEQAANFGRFPIIYIYIYVQYIYIYII
jgi:E3 ubiquitin-protein ligase listerin